MGQAQQKSAAPLARRVYPFRPQVGRVFRTRTAARRPVMGNPPFDGPYFKELDYRPTPMGALSLRRRRELSLGVDVFEIKLGEEYLMSSLFTASEIALARLGLAELSGADLMSWWVDLALATPPKRCWSMRGSGPSSLSRR
jgi:hypothetical protein